MYDVHQDQPETCETKNSRPRSSLKTKTKTAMFSIKTKRPWPQVPHSWHDEDESLTSLWRHTETWWRHSAAASFASAAADGVNVALRNLDSLASSSFCRFCCKSLPPPTQRHLGYIHIGFLVSCYVASYTPHFVSCPSVRPSVHLSRTGSQLQNETRR